MQHRLLNIGPKMLVLTVTNGWWNLKAPTQNLPILEHSILSLFPIALHQQFINLSTIIRFPFTARTRKVLPPCCLRRHNINFKSFITTLCLATMREEKQKEHYHHHHMASSSSSSSSSSPSESDEELQHMLLAPPLWTNNKRLSKQLSMCEKPRDIAWERRRMQERRRSSTVCDDLTDEDLHELKGCIELGFGFNEEDGQRLCNTLPALDLYFAVNRRLSPSPVSTPQSRASSLGGRSSSFGSPRSDADSWKICSPGDDPEHVKTKLRHWAQAVACSVMQSS